MKEHLVYDRYAKALLKSIPEDKLDVLSAQLSEFAKLLETDDNLRRVLHDLTLNLDVQYDILRALGQKAELDPVLLRLLDLIVHNRKTMCISGIAQAFAEAVDAHHERVLVIATSKQPLKPEHIKALEEKMSGLLKKKNVKVEAVINPNMIGGLTLRVGNYVIDRTIRGSLRALTNELLKS